MKTDDPGGLELLPLVFVLIERAASRYQLAVGSLVTTRPQFHARARYGTAFGVLHMLVYARGAWRAWCVVGLS